MKKITWEHPNKQRFESLHKTFNRQTSCISTGNVVSGTQYSSFVRAFVETKCNGMSFKEGHLQDFDLESFERLNVPFYVIEKVRELTHSKGGILYLFKHYTSGSRVLDGVVLTTEDHEHIKTWYLNNTHKAQDAVDEATKYITA